jgi:hypothetical protein
MTITIRHVLDLTAINRQITGPNGVVARELLRRGLRVQTRAKHLVPVDQGRLRDSIEIATENRVVMGIETVVIVVGTNVSYATAVHDGSGIYGPTGVPIIPVNGKYLVFTSKKSGRLVFTKAVRGQPGTRFLKRALPAARG